MPNRTQHGHNTAHGAVNAVIRHSKGADDNAVGHKPYHQHHQHAHIQIHRVARYPPAICRNLRFHNLQIYSI